jgi:hypothetical protein
MFFDLKRREIQFKIVYYGPAFSGKTTNLRVIYEKFPGIKGNLISIDTQGERTLFFDFLPIEIRIVRNFKTRFYIYTVPGQVIYKASRRLVLKGADGVVFVADSQKDRLEENISTLRELYENFDELGLSEKSIPIIFQYNKRDLSEILPIPVLEEKLNWYHFPYVESIAITGKGVFKTLETILKAVLQDFLRKAKYGAQSGKSLG